MPADPSSEPRSARASHAQATHVDAHVGARIKLRRMLLGISQDRLAASVGVSHQQMLLYERGTNRLSAASLYAFARALEVPVDFFFEGLPGHVIDANADAPSASRPASDDPFDPGKDGRMQRETRALIQAYSRIRDPENRQTVLDLVRRLSAGSKRA